MAQDASKCAELDFTLLKWPATGKTSLSQSSQAPYYQRYQLPALDCTQIIIMICKFFNLGGRGCIWAATLSNEGFCVCCLTYRTTPAGMWHSLVGGGSASWMLRQQGKGARSVVPAVCTGPLPALLCVSADGVHFLFDYCCHKYCLLPGLITR